MAFGKTKNRRWLDITYIAVAVAAIATVSVVYLLYTETQDILKEKLRERLTSIAATAALQFEANELDAIQDRTSIGTKEIKVVTQKMNNIRDSVENVKFIYLIRPSPEPNIQYFIADADTLAPLEELDENENNILDEEENPPWPGDEYDSSELPAFQDALSGIATADYELNSDQWGTFLSGYAPIKNERDEVVAVLGIDVEVSEFNVLVRSTLLPFAALSTFLLLVLFILTLTISKVWKNRVEIITEIDRQKDELLSLVSHQLATPVSSIKWYVEMMQDGDLGKITKDQAEHLKSMQSISTNMSDLVSMILDVSRIQLGKIRIEKQPLDLDNFFKEIIEVIEPKAEERKIGFKKNVVKNLGTAMLDKRYTRMTVENLLTNAIKYSKDYGKVTLDVAIEEHRLKCKVTDKGLGIPKEDQAKIFGKLYRASNVRNAVEGNGFGLYIAKGAIEAQGGKIWFESRLGVGTTFYFDLPLK